LLALAVGRLGGDLAAIDPPASVAADHRQPVSIVRGYAAGLRAAAGRVPDPCRRAPGGVPDPVGDQLRERRLQRDHRADPRDAEALTAAPLTPGPSGRRSPTPEL
jgi:hypothetical protein